MKLFKTSSRARRRGFPWILFSLFFRSVRFALHAGGLHHWQLPGLPRGQRSQQKQLNSTITQQRKRHRQRNDNDENDDTDDDNDNNKNTSETSRNQRAETRNSIRFSFCGCASLDRNSSEFRSQASKRLLFAVTMDMDLRRKLSNNFRTNRCTGGEISIENTTLLRRTFVNSSAAAPPSTSPEEVVPPACL